MTNYQVENREWWVERWLELLDSYRFKKRLERARIYAREGNVLSIEFVGAQVLAKVQGSEPEPYQVSLWLDPFSDEDWDYVVATLSQKAIFSAQLLSGQMPDEIESAFISNGLSLFPFSLTDVRSRCSCPDKANPCKHIGAVYYQLGDRFSEDPFVLFQLRGRTKTHILEALRQKRSQNTTPIQPSLPVSETETTKKKRATKASSDLDLASFWQYDQPIESSLVVISPPVDNKTIVDLLGKFPLSYDDAQAVKQFLDTVYPTVSQQAVMSALNATGT
ncbi:SWIM zinc finger family protein [Chroococcus sp. FPU101]|uniref:SWIM zinc finger family protein n=1 Tax=Chroococcus sp. FPU101 TaxID=1974212 RepID=UPI001A9051FB|nr:SWIM zinc finger family protein [Chroococcus sp. FPU101]GFE68631.1 zinc finger SWIM domain protein [Chroococcus sp. FPU101]